MTVERLLSKTEVARMFSVSVRTVDRMMKHGSLKRVPIRGCVRFKLNDVLRVMEGESK